jgi:hypothetical protein
MTFLKKTVEQLRFEQMHFEQLTLTPSQLFAMNIQEGKNTFFLLKTHPDAFLYFKLQSGFEQIKI